MAITLSTVTSGCSRRLVIRPLNSGGTVSYIRALSTPSDIAKKQGLVALQACNIRSDILSRILDRTELLQSGALSTELLALTKTIYCDIVTQSATGVIYFVLVDQLSGNNHKLLLTVNLVGCKGDPHDSLRLPVDICT